MTFDKRATITVESPGQHLPPQSGVSLDEVIETLRRLAGIHDVTMIVVPESSDERLMIAVDGSRAFLGLERPDGLLQFTSAKPHSDDETLPFTIGGQEADIETRYLLDLQTAAAVVREWLQGGDLSLHGHWERR